MHRVEADIVNLAKGVKRKEKYSVCTRSDKILPTVRMCVQVRRSINVVMSCNALFKDAALLVDVIWNLRWRKCYGAWLTGITS